MNGIHRIDQKIVCIEDFSTWKNRPVCVMEIPLLNGVYMVRAFTTTCDDDNLVGLLLREIHNPRCNCYDEDEISFNIEFFRPVVEDESKTDIGFAQKILQEQTVKMPKPKILVEVEWNK